jgi:hypothetical protein
MASDIFYTLSKAELKKEIAAIAANDQRSLPPRAKVFAAIAKKQRFDLLPDSVSAEEIDKICNGGAVELNRGLSTSNGLPAIHYARELLQGPLYPGTQSAMGNGIHLAEPSKEHGVPGFAKISVIANEYASMAKPGMIVRCALKTSAAIIDFDELRKLLRENRNRIRDIGITDAGAFAAALGFDAIFCEHVYDHTNEKCWIVLNRGALVFQNSGLQIA